MRNNPLKLVLTASLGLAISLTFSCSGGDDPDGGGVSCDMSGYKKVGMPDGKTWMAENLNCNVAGSVCYDNDPANCAKYGRLYNWAAAKKACSGGWHLPSDAEWSTLVNSIESEKTCSDCAARYLKSSTEWDDCGVGDSYSYQCLDSYRFSALPGGGGGISGGGFGGVGYDGNWWGTSESSSDVAYTMDMNYDSEYVYYNYNLKDNLFSVRCVQD